MCTAGSLAAHLRVTSAGHARGVRYDIGPRVIAHRGASGHRPEHTRAAYELAFRLGADSVELDLVATRDGEVVCRHDVELSRTTDVAEHPEYAARRRTLWFEGTLTTGWFVHDFTLAELRALRCRERWPRKRPAGAGFDGQEPVMTFAEVLSLVDAESARQGRLLGVHAELKSPAHLARYGLELPQLLAGVDRPGLTWMSFDAEALRAMSAPERSVRLHLRPPRSRDLARTAEYAAGIGVRRKAVLPRESGQVGRPSRLVEKAHARGLEVLVWTHRAENKHLPASLRVGEDPHGHGRAQLEAELLLQAGIDGLITDFPEVVVRARAALPALPVAQ